MPHPSCTIRNLSATDEAAAYLDCAGPAISDVTDRFARYLESGSFRPEWLWLALQGDRVVARAAFWGRPDGEQPLALDHFDIDPAAPDGVEIGAELLRTAYTALRTDRTPDYHLFLPPDWRGHPEAEAVRRHLHAAELAGFTLAVERHRLEWTPELPLPPRTGSLQLRGVTAADDDLLVHLLAQVTAGSLDQGTVEAAATVGPERAARDYLSDMDALDATRRRWLIGEDAAGDVVGVVISADTANGGHVGFVGVAPEHRGHGHGVALLSETTRRFAEAGAQVIRADTDHQNTPMIEVFRRCCWRVWGARIVMQRKASG